MPGCVASRDRLALHSVGASSEKYTETFTEPVTNSPNPAMANAIDLLCP